MTNPLNVCNNLNEEARIFNTFVSNESQILESLKLIQHNQDELNQIINEVEGVKPSFELGEIRGKKSMVENKPKKKIHKNPIETFIEN